MLKAQILEFDRLILAWHRSNEASRRLDAIPGVGPALATALVASVAHPRAFRSGRDSSARIELIPTQRSSGARKGGDRRRFRPGPQPGRGAAPPRFIARLRDTLAVRHARHAISVRRQLLGRAQRRG